MCSVIFRVSKRKRMSSSPVCSLCKLSAGIQCLHCVKDFCRRDFREHENEIAQEIHPLVNRLNQLIELSLRPNEQKKAFQTRIDKMKARLKPFVDNELNNVMTLAEKNHLEVELAELESLMKQHSPAVVPRLFSLLDLKMPQRTCAIKLEACPMASNDKYLLAQNTAHTLTLYDCDKLAPFRQLPWPTKGRTSIVDMHWSPTLVQFLVLTRDQLYALDGDALLSTNSDSRTMTSDEHRGLLFIGTSNGIDEYSLGNLVFTQRHKLADDPHLQSLRWNSVIDQFGLTLRGRGDHRWSFEVRDSALTRLWSVRTPIATGLCSLSILSNEWMIVNTRGDLLFQVTGDGRMKAEVIYGGRFLLNAIDHRGEWLIVRTEGYLEQHAFGSMLE